MARGCDDDVPVLHDGLYDLGARGLRGRDVVEEAALDPVDAGEHVAQRLGAQVRVTVVQSLGSKTRGKNTFRQA